MVASEILGRGSIFPVLRAVQPRTDLCIAASFLVRSKVQDGYANGSRWVLWLRIAALAAATLTTLRESTVHSMRAVAYVFMPVVVLALLLLLLQHKNLTRRSMCTT